MISTFGHYEFLRKLFDSVKKPYESYLDEIRAWICNADLGKEKQGIVIALSIS